MSINERKTLAKQIAIKILSQLPIQISKNLLHRSNPIRKQIPIIGISRLRLYDQENQTKKREVKVQQSLPLDEVVNSKIEEEIKKLDLANMTPIEALNVLYKLKDEL